MNKIIINIYCQDVKFTAILLYYSCRPSKTSLFLSLLQDEYLAFKVAP